MIYNRAARCGFTVEKCRSRTPGAPGYGTYRMRRSEAGPGNRAWVIGTTHYGASLKDISDWLDGWTQFAKGIQE